ncbi:hypothetical protein ONZ45_g19311 [Pleurotus djamor]|nr:hypothetical protein ONZ45_g19311 [Pleurotus djamor]
MLDILPIKPLSLIAYRYDLTHADVFNVSRVSKRLRLRVNQVIEAQYALEPHLSPYFSSVEDTKKFKRMLLSSSIVVAGCIPFSYFTHAPIAENAPLDIYVSEEASFEVDIDLELLKYRVYLTEASLSTWISVHAFIMDPTEPPPCPAQSHCVRVLTSLLTPSISQDHPAQAVVTFLLCDGKQRSRAINLWVLKSGKGVLDAMASMPSTMYMNYFAAGRAVSIFPRETIIDRTYVSLYDGLSPQLRYPLKHRVSGWRHASESQSFEHGFACKRVVGDINCWVIPLEGVGPIDDEAFSSSMLVFTMDRRAFPSVLTIDAYESAWFPLDL